MLDREWKVYVTASPAMHSSRHTGHLDLHALHSNTVLFFSYLLSQQVVYLTICDASYPRKLAFSYLDELSKEFQRSYESQIGSANRPYCFRGFGEPVWECAISGGRWLTLLI